MVRPEGQGIMSALARVLCSADGLDPDARERGAGPLWEHYQAQAARLLADPAPLLAALAEAGVLTEEEEYRWDQTTPQHRYVSAWTEVQP